MVLLAIVANPIRNEYAYPNTPDISQFGQKNALGKINNRSLKFERFHTQDDMIAGIINKKHRFFIKDSVTLKLCSLTEREKTEIICILINFTF